mgnify:CR=1 FL=1
MGFFGALYTGAAGMLAQERSTSNTSENIANVTTVGYKRKDTAFHDLVSTNKSSTSSQNTVYTTQVNRISQQGPVQQTASVSDIAITGNGFFTVRDSITNPDSEFLYTRNGSFSADNQGILRNTAGYALYGWSVDNNGAVASGPGTASLVPVDVDILATSSVPTSAASLYLNLDANEVPYNPHQFSTVSNLPASGEAAHFARGIEVFDSNGTSRILNVEFRSVVGPMAHFSSLTTADTGGMERSESMVDNPTSATPAITDGDILQISDGSNTLDVTFRNGAVNASLNEANTVQDMLNRINNFQAPDGSNPFTATLDSRNQLLVQANDPTVTLDVGGSSANVLSATGLNLIPDPDVPSDYTYEPEADLLTDGTANPTQSTFPAFSDSSSPNPFHWWEVRITINDPATPNDSTNQVEISKGLINFNGDGSANMVTDANGQALIDLGTIDFDSSDASEATAITLDIGRTTQVGGSYDVIQEDQNGAGLGSFQDYALTDEGFVEAIFSNGQRLNIYKIPLANFANPDGLERVSGTAFAESADSGAVTINDVQTGGVGSIGAARIENSNVDVADEFSMLIVSQRAYGLNSRVITAVDEMTEQAAQLKR